MSFHECHTVGALPLASARANGIGLPGVGPDFADNILPAEADDDLSPWCREQRRARGGFKHRAAETSGIARLGERNPFFYAASADMGHLMQQVGRVASQETTVLLTGETGTGKTHLARLIHELSPRREERFLVVDCAALSASLIESELFGHVKGAFTGAAHDRTGKLAEAGRGTLLLDEIDALPPALQAKLLRAVDERVFVPVGSNQTLPVEARLIGASNRALEQEVATGRFRPDLYYRLNVVKFHLPPLREQPELIEPLAHQFLTEFAARHHRDLVGITADALQALLDYPWPGNVRELRNVIERAVVLCTSPKVQRDELPDSIWPGCSWVPSSGASRPVGPCTCSRPSTLARKKQEVEVTRITEALRRHKNNRMRAAAELGISRVSLYNKMHKYGLMGAKERRETLA